MKINHLDLQLYIVIQNFRWASPPLSYVESPPPLRVFIRGIVDRERAIFPRRILHLLWPTDENETDL